MQVYKTVILFCIVFTIESVVAQNKQKHTSFEGCYQMILSDTTYNKIPMMVCKKEEYVRTDVPMPIIFKKGMDSIYVILNDSQDNPYYIKVPKSKKTYGVLILRGEVTNTQETKEINGFLCEKIVIENDLFSTTYWLSKDIVYPLDMLHINGNNNAILTLKKYNINGFPIEIETKNYLNKQLYKQTITQIIEGELPYTIFDLSGYKEYIQP